ncbi:MAG TPA: hypothetical protein VFE47_04240 [Tepidisphaeraceae bacterium]|jgi:hypothetical protein|nr:hypothetical protein [Tepidisphaeraceae bacterium]
MTQAPTPNSSTNPGDRSIFGPVHLTRAIIIITAILCAVLFYYAARWVGWPSEPGFGGSMAQSKALLSFIVAIVLLIVCTLGGTVIAGRRWFLAGLMAATAGLSTWSVRGGTMIPVLFNAQDSGANHAVFLKMIGELVVFFGVIGGLWNLIWKAGNPLEAGSLNATSKGSSRAVRVGNAAKVLSIFSPLGHALQDQARLAASQPPSEEGKSTGAALLAQIAIMLILTVFFVATPLKKQVLTSVFVAGVISTAIAEYFFADRKAGRWYWIAPLVVGVIGYAAGYINPAGLGVGAIQGAFGPLTRVLPLDYASMGCAGVLFGYWWMEPDGSDEPPIADGDAPAKTTNSPAVDDPAKPAADAA